MLAAPHPPAGWLGWRKDIIGSRGADAGRQSGLGRYRIEMGTVLFH